MCTRNSLYDSRHFRPAWLWKASGLFVRPVDVVMPIAGTLVAKIYQPCPQQQRESDTE